MLSIFITNLLETFEMLCAIWYHLYNLKNVKNTRGGMLKPATLLKVTLLHWSFSCILKLYKWYRMLPNRAIRLKYF